MRPLGPAALQAIRVLAVDPAGVGGLILRGCAGPERDALLRELQALVPAGTPWRRLPVNVDEQRLSGGVDLGLSLAAGRPVRTAGLLAETAGGVLVVPMAERLEVGGAARLALAMEPGGGASVGAESRAVVNEHNGAFNGDGGGPGFLTGGDVEDMARNGNGSCLTSRGLAIVALDEGQSDDEVLPSSLRERLGLMVMLSGEAEPSEFRGEQTPQPVRPLTARPAPTAPALQTSGASMGAGSFTPAKDIAQARERLRHIPFDHDAVAALCAAAAALGLDSMRTVWQAWAVARAAAALAGRDQVAQEDAEWAARLVLAPRARAIPSSPAGEEANGDQAAPNADKTEWAEDADRDCRSHDTRCEADGDGDGDGTDSGRGSGSGSGTAASASPPNLQEAPYPTPDVSDPDADSSPTPCASDSDADSSSITGAAALQARTLAAAKAAIPLGLLQSLSGAANANNRSTGASGRSTGRGAAASRLHTSGRPLTSRRGPLSGGRRLDLLATLRAAVPWQRLRLQEREQQGLPPAATRLLLRREDVHLKRYRRPQETTTLFVVDASGSQALNRLAEAKGAVELLLADCYVRRDRVALLAFRGDSAELLLSPTRSLARARRALASLPGGGGTPLAAGIEAAWLLGRQVQSREGGRAVLVFLTDARANVALDGSPGRERAAADALLSARRLRLDGLQSLWIDTAPRPVPAGMVLAQAMGARYVPLPHGQAAQVYAAVSDAVSPRS